MADNNSKTFISGIVIFAVLVILGFVFFANGEEDAPVITDEIVVEATDVEEVDPALDAAQDLDASLDEATETENYIPVTTVPVVEGAPEPEAGPAEDTEQAAEQTAEEAAEEAIDAAQDAVEDAAEAVEEMVEDTVEGETPADETVQDETQE